MLQWTSLYMSPWAPMQVSLGNILQNGISGLWGMIILNFISVKLSSELTELVYHWEGMARWRYQVTLPSSSVQKQALWEEEILQGKTAETNKDQFYAAGPGTLTEKGDPQPVIVPLWYHYIADRPVPMVHWCHDSSGKKQIWIKTLFPLERQSPHLSST